MIVRSSIAFLLSGLFAAASFSCASASPGEADALHTLATSTNNVALERACRHLVPALWVSVPIRSAFKRNSAGDAAFRAYALFLNSQRNTPARISCLITLRNLSITSIDRSRDLKSGSPYAQSASKLIRHVLRADPSAVVRAAAAQALWGSALPEDGVALLHSAERDPSAEVRSASFRNMLWPARADIFKSHDLASYDKAIDAALKSANSRIAGAALIARTSLHGIAADPATRPYAFDKRPFVRASAIDSYEYMGAYNGSIVCFIESRLQDTSPEVRSSVMQRLFMMGDHAAIPAIRNIAQNAPTPSERKEAADYVRAIVNQPSFPHSTCARTAAKPI